MLQDIRANSQGTIAKIIIGLIVISFSIFGIESLLFSGGSSGVAEVNGEDISAYALQQEVSVQQRQLLAMLGENADPALLDQNQLSNQALQNLVQRELVKQAAESLRITVATQNVNEIITGMEQFQIDGVFSPDMYQSSLASAGFTPSLFRERLTEDLMVGQLRAGLAGSDFSTPAELELAVAIGREGRDLRYISLPLVDYLAEAEVSATEIENYYDDNPLEFQSEENLVLDYLQLDVDSYREPVAEQLLREEFELVRGEYELAMETRVSHILLEARGQELEERLAAIDAALDGGMSFEDAAREYSDDIGSAGMGGDLGYTAGDTFPDAMEEALAALDVGARSEPVRTDAGTHILLVTDRRDGTEVTFEDVRFELEEQLQLAEAEAALLRDTERLRDIAFNAADLSEPANALSMEVQQVEGITRQQSVGLFSNPRLLQAAFSEDVLEAGHNSEVIEISPQQFVVFRVAERRAPELRPLNEVRSGIESQLRDRKARESARAEAATMLAALEAGNSVEETANAAGRDWQVELGATRDSARLPASLRNRLFSLEPPVDGLAVREIVDDSRGDIYLLEFTRATPGSIDNLSSAQQEQWRQRVAGEAGGVLQQQYEAALRNRADIVIY